jgi:putative ABC transport system permease protein
MKDNQRKPPRIAWHILNRLMPNFVSVSALGDFDEIYDRILSHKGRFRASLWYWRQTLKAVPYSIYWGVVMLKSYMKTSWRSLLRYKVYSTINLFGLAIGIACSLLIFLWIQDELSYDRFHENSDRIYRVVTESQSDGNVNRIAITPAPLASALTEDFPGIVKAVTLDNNVFFIRYQNRRFNERVFFSDPEFFDIFTLPLIKGDSKTALKEPYTIVISESASNKYFGEDDPLGKILTFDKEWTFKITGVFKDIPENSHLRFDFLASIMSYKSRYMDQWGVSNFHTYVLTSEEFSPERFQDLIPDFVEKYRGSEVRHVYKLQYLLQPITSIHLHSHLKGEVRPNGNMNNIFIFSAIALFILLIACFNYINLSTARYTTRVKEVGIRKVVGAHRLHIIKQFLGESTYITFIALIIAVITAHLLLPIFNSLAGKELGINYIENHELWIFMILIILGISAASGSYPALLFSVFRPANVLKGTECVRMKGHFLRKTLIVVQFAISIIFIVGTLTIHNQLNYVRNKKLGFNKEHVVNIPLYDEDALNKIEIIKNEFLQNSNILSVSASGYRPGGVVYNQSYWYEGASEDKNLMIQWIAVDHDFLNTYEIELVTGRNFSKQFPSDIEQAYILNESAVKEIGWESPLGKQFEINKKGTVIGVIKDFHFESLHQKLEPMALCVYPGAFECLAVRIRPGNIPNVLNFMQNKWQNLVPNQVFQFSFLDEDYDNLYRAETRLSKIFSYITFFTIVIACLGLFGLTALITELRTKEIAVRKVLGASITGIVAMLSREFLKLVLAANIIAWPVAWYAVNKWLGNFSYRINLGIWIFFLSGILVLVIAFAAVIYQSVKAAAANPIDLIRYE